MEDSSKDGDNIWSTVVYTGSTFGGIRVYNYDGNSEESLVEFTYGVIFGVFESKSFGLTESSNLGEDIGCSESVWIVVSEWNIEVIIEGAMIGCS